MADQWVRLCMALVLIALVSAGLYQFGSRASTVQPNVRTLTFHR